MMDILMSETCWSHKKWNKIASDIKLVFYSSVATDVCSGLPLRMIISLVQWNNFTTVGYSVYLYGKVKINPCPANVENMASS